MINGIFAKKFDDVAIVPTFVLTPLTYLGGVFYSIDQLPVFWQKISLFSIDETIRITTTGLKFPLKNEMLPTLYAGTLNTVIDDEFLINISHGEILIYCAF